MNRILKLFLALSLVLLFVFSAIGCDIIDDLGLFESGTVEGEGGGGSSNGGEGGGGATDLGGGNGSGTTDSSNGETGTGNDGTTDSGNNGSGTNTDNNGDTDSGNNGETNTGNGGTTDSGNSGSGTNTDNNGATGSGNSGTGTGNGGTTESGNGGTTGSGNSGTGTNTGNGGSGTSGTTPPTTLGNGVIYNSKTGKYDVVYTDIQVNAYGGFTVPAYSGQKYYVINNNNPFFTSSEIVTTSYERYDSLDSLGRVTLAMGCLGKDLMPTVDRGDISEVKPTGWNQANYSGVVKGGYLYNRCHLIAHQLTGEDANRQNLMTGTRYMNETMIPFENQIADYIKETNNHVMYRITPVFTGNNLLADGVILEAYSVEDNGDDDGISICVFIYNVQPDVVLDYKTGASALANPVVKDESSTGGSSGDSTGEKTYIVNKNPNSMKIHDPDCTHVKNMSESNKWEYTGDIDDLLEEGYTKCKTCNPE